MALEVVLPARQLWGDVRTGSALSTPSPEEVILHAISLEKFGRKLFGSIDRGARVEFSNLGTLTRITPINQV
ncbi:MAG: hypothetical protein L0220_06650 [Acidobacteria bacterium]|nr:hypothetical protein [Acidobacteriota bacterium]